MMLLVSLAVLSLVFRVRAEVPAMFTGTWRMTGMPRGNLLHDEFTQNANGDYTGKGWGTWSENITSGTNNYTYSGITADAVCETDASTGAVTHRSKWTFIEDWDLGANPVPSWNTPTGQKHVFCGYNTYDDATDIMTVTNYRGPEYIALSVDPGACPATVQEAATNGLSWAAEATTPCRTRHESSGTATPWACDADATRRTRRTRWTPPRRRLSFSWTTMRAPRVCADAPIRACTSRCSSPRSGLRSVQVKTLSRTRVRTIDVRSNRSDK